jgi:hypothetical protein
MFSGYGAGVRSPGWYEHLWVHHDRLPERWMTRVARLMRDEGLDASPASVIEAVRLADSLAALRGRAAAGLDEFGEATLAILCHGNPMPLRVVEARLIVGDRLGSGPAEAPTVPLQRDLAAQQRSLRLKVAADETVLDLDQRRETDLARSRLLHRLNLLRIGWGKLSGAGDQRRRAGTFHEVWTLQWRPEFAVAVMEAARWGNTVAEAAAAFVEDQARGAASLPARLSLALSRGGDPAAAAAWLEGFLGGSGMVLVHDDRLLSIVDGWVCSLPRETFERVCPIARRTFSTFERPERRLIGEKLRRGAPGPAAGPGEGGADDFDADRAALVEPVLRLILGDDALGDSRP